MVQRLQQGRNRAVDPRCRWSLAEGRGAGQGHRPDRL